MTDNISLNELIAALPIITVTETELYRSSKAAGFGFCAITDTIEGMVETGELTETHTPEEIIYAIR